MTHTFLFEPARWDAVGRFIDGNGKEVDLTGYADIIHTPERWLNNSQMTVAFEEPVTFDNRYELIPLQPGALETRWTSVNPSIGLLTGIVAVVGDSLLFQYESRGREHHGSEYLQQLADDRYLNRGVFFSMDRRVSSWLAELRRSD